MGPKQPGLVGGGGGGEGLGWGRGRQVVHTQGAQGPQGRCLQGFMEDDHGPQLALQGRGAAPPSVLCACEGGADAALLQGGHQPRPPAKLCCGWDRLGAGQGGVRVSQGGRDWWQRQPRGGGRCAVPSGADTAGGERLRGQGWGSGQVTAKPGAPSISGSSQ